MKNFILPLLVIFFISACEKNNSDDLINADTSNAYLKAGNQVAICHKSGDNWHVNYVNINAWPAHEAHGDAIDMDGDGYFDRECGCSEVDCDDNDPEVTTDCGSQSQEESPFPIEYGGNTIYVYPIDNGTDIRFTSADGICETLSAFGYEDWYLPSKGELDAIHTELDPGVMVGSYWTSTEDGLGGEYHWYQDFPSGNQSTGDSRVGDGMKCRCVRK